MTSSSPIQEVRDFLLRLLERMEAGSAPGDVFVNLVEQTLDAGPPLSAAACELLDELSGLRAAAQIASMRRLAAEGFTGETVPAILGLALSRAGTLPSVMFEAFDARRVAEEAEKLLWENVGPMLGRVIEVDEIAAESAGEGRVKISLRYRWVGSGELDEFVTVVGGA